MSLKKIKGVEHGIDYKYTSINRASSHTAGKISKACLEVRKINLSQAYELPDETIVTGEIIDIEGGGLTDKEKEIVREIEGKEVEFIVWVSALGSVDWLYISKNSWFIFRDYAILPGMGYTIKVKLTEAKYDGKIVPIFPKRDVIEG